MRIAHLSDLHVTVGDRLADQAATLSGIVDDAIASGVDLWLLTGDFFGLTVPYSSKPAERAVLLPQIVRMARVAPVVICYGNHDADLDLDTFACLDGDWPVRVVKRAEAFDVNTAAGPAHLYVLPYPTKRWALDRGDGTARARVEAQGAVEAALATLLHGWHLQMRAQRERSLPGLVEPVLLLAHLQVAGCTTSGGEVLQGQEVELRRDQLEALPVDYGALGHIHLHQEPARRCFYAGSAWRTDFSETETKGWVLVDVGTEVQFGDGVTYPEEYGEGRYALRVEHRASACRELLTLDYRWALATEGDERPRWTVKPAAVDFDRVAATHAEVRMRLVVPEQWVGGCPWDQEVARVLALGAVRVRVEKRVEPVLRIRAPEVAAAESLPAKVAAFWSTLATAPDERERAAALAVLDELSTHSDEQVLAETNRLTEAR